MSFTRTPDVNKTIGILAYVVAIATTAAILAVRHSFGFKAGDNPLLILFIIPITLSTYLGGLGPGLTATVLAALGAAYYLLLPLHASSIYSPRVRDSWSNRQLELPLGAPRGY